MCVIRNRAIVVSSPENVWLTRAFPPSFSPHRICTSVRCILSIRLSFEGSQVQGKEAILAKLTVFI